MGKFKVGDVVRIKTHLTDKQKGLSPHFTQEMSKYRGKKAIITSKSGDWYNINIDHGYYSWIREWFEKVLPAERSTTYED